MRWQRHDASLIRFGLLFFESNDVRIKIDLRPFNLQRFAAANPTVVEEDDEWLQMYVGRSAILRRCSG